MQITVSLFYSYRTHLSIITYVFIYFVCMHVGTHAILLLRRSDNSWMSVLSFHPVDPRNQTQVLKLGGKCLFIL